jgi:protein gp37
VIAGCESGPKRRPCNHDWLRSLRDQCARAGVPFFLKQMVRGGTVVKMPALDGVVHGAYPEVK